MTDGVVVYLTKLFLPAVMNHCEICEQFVTAAHFIVRHCSLCQ